MLQMQIIKDLANSAADFHSDPRLPVMSESEAIEMSQARKDGFATVAEYHAAIKAQFAAERREQEAQAELDRLLSETSNLAQWWHLLTALKDKRDHLRSGIARLQRHGQSVQQTQAAIVEASKAAVKRLLVSVGLASPGTEAGPAVDQAALDAALVAETRAAKEAEEALAIASVDLASVERQIASVENQRDRYLRPVLDHISTRCTNDYLNAIANLRKAYSRLVACGYALDEIRGSYGNGWPNAEKFEFPRVPTMPAVGRDKLTITMSADDVDLWKSVADKLTKNPDENISIRD